MLEKFKNDLILNMEIKYPNFDEYFMDIDGSRCSCSKKEADLRSDQKPHLTKSPS